MGNNTSILRFYIARTESGRTVKAKQRNREAILSGISRYLLLERKKKREKRFTPISVFCWCSVIRKENHHRCSFLRIIWAVNLMWIEGKNGRPVASGRTGCMVSYLWAPTPTDNSPDGSINYRGMSRGLSYKGSDSPLPIVVPAVARFPSLKTESRLSIGNIEWC